MRRAVGAALERRALEQAPDSTALEYVCDWIAGGATLRELTRKLEEELVMGELPASIVTQYLRSKYGEEATDAAFVAARAVGAHAMVDEARDIIDNADTESREELKKAELRAHIRQWTAGKYNRKAYGEDKSPLLQVTVHNMHLDALRVREVATPIELPALPATDIEVLPSRE